MGKTIRAHSRSREILVNYSFLLPGLLLFTLIIFIPFIANIILSFTQWSGVTVPDFIGIDNYARALFDGQFWRSFLNNLLLIIAMTIVPTIVGIGLSIMLFEVIGKGPLKKTVGFFRGGFYLPQVIAIVVSAVAWKWLLNPTWGALNMVFHSIGQDSWQKNWLGDSDIAIYSIMALMVWYQIGYTLVIFLSALERINPELIESAAIDGASLRVTVFSIIIPQITFEISVVVLTTLIHALKVFGPVYAMTKGGPGDATQVLSFYSFKSFFEKGEVGYGSTVSTIISVIIVIISVIFIRYRNKREDEVIGV